MPAIMTGWKAITAYLGLSRHLVVTRGYPVRRQPGGYGVWADAAELDAHTSRLFNASPTLMQHEPAPDSTARGVRPGLPGAPA